MPAHTFSDKHASARKIAIVPRTLGANIRRIRDSKRPVLSRAKLSAMTGIDPQSIADIEADRYESTAFAKVFRLAKGLRVSLDDLVFGLDAEYDATVRSDLARHGGNDKKTPLNQAGVDGPSPAEARLQERINDLERQLAASRDLARTLVGELSGRPAKQEVRGTARPSAGRRKRT